MGIWSYADADEMESSGDGLFDQDRIVKYFEHRDDCDKDLITTVTLHNGLGCPTATKVSCTLADDGDSNGQPDSTNDNHACFAGVFQYTGADGYQAGGTNLLDNVGTTGTGSRWQKFHEYIAGSYSIKYQAEDSAGHTTSVCRDILNVDHTFPIIQILGSDQMTLEATHQGNYIDDGATCSDQVDGVISQNVEVSGDVVNLSKVGTYTITYNCKDSANNEAPAAQRTVVVAQTSCPKCTMYGEHTGAAAGTKHTLVHEASFPYIDAGARCSDVIDGDVTVLCSTTNPGAPAESADNCKTPTNLVNVDQTGTYTITYRAQNTVGLWNTGTNCRGGPNTYERVVTVKDTLRPVITLRYGTTGTDSDPLVAQGAISAQNDATKDYNKIDGSTYKTEWEEKRDERYAAGGTNAERREFRDYPASQLGSVHPETLMAEQTTSSVNGWVIGAFASAVAGLALLGYSTRRTTVATSVPV